MAALRPEMTEKRRKPSRPSSTRLLTSEIHLSLLQADLQTSRTPSTVRFTDKRKKDEMKTLYRNIRSHDTLQSRGSMSSNELNSTVSSTRTMSVVDPDHQCQLLKLFTDGEFTQWSMRWSIDKVGKAPGQLRGPRGVCMSRNSGNVIVADSKNARLQMFSGSSGKLISVLGADSPDQRIATMFSRVSQRRMEPVGLCENYDGSLLFVTDLNRILVLDCDNMHTQDSNFEVVVHGKSNLSGIAVTHGNKWMLSEVHSTRSSVGLYENNGTLIRAFKGDFRSPSHLTWNEEYELLAVSDGELQCISLYNASGKLLNKFGRTSSSSSSRHSKSSNGIVPVPFGYPTGVCWMDDLRLLVADRAEHRVVAIDIRNFGIEEVLNGSDDGIIQPVAMATNGRNQIALTEEYYDFHVNQFSLKMFATRSPLEALQF